MSKSFHVVCLEPGADNPKKHEPPPDPEPPEGFVDNTVYRYRIDEDGNKVLIGTMDAFPEGWDHPQQFWEKGFQKQSKEDEEMAKKDIDFGVIVARAQEVAAERGISLYKASGIVAKETGLHRTTVYNHARAMLQTPSPTSAQVGSQKPVPGTQPNVTAGAGKGVAPPPKQTPTNETDDFTADDDEPMPYILAPDHHNVAEEIACLLDRKGQDYGTENIKKFGSQGVLVRVSDKVERLINLSRKDGQVNFESVEDTWKDIAGYAILALIELREGR